MKKLLSTTGTVILRITMLAAFVMNIGIGNLWAEEYAVTDFKLGKEGTAKEYRTKFNEDHGTYVTIAINNENSSKTFSDEGYISPTGASNEYLGIMSVLFPVYDYRGSVTLTPAVGCYIMNYQTYLGTERLSEDLEKSGYDYDAAVNVGTELSSEFKNTGSFLRPKYSITWTNAQHKKNSSGDDALIRGNHNQSTHLVFNVGYFAVEILGTEIPSNRPYLKNLSTTIWVPEVLHGVDEVSMSLVKAANTPSAVVTKTYKVQHSMALGDFKCEFKNRKGEGGAEMKGSLEFVNNTPSYDETNQTLTVEFQYVSASGDDFAEDYTAELVISSNNTVNTNVWTTHINGSAGDRAQNNLRWNLQEPYYVNSLIEDPTFFDSDAEIIYGTSDGTIAKFEDVDSDGIKELRLLKSGTVTLSAKQEANTNYFGKELDDITITVVKRTPEFEINPTGYLYTSRTYTQYISPKSGVDPNGTMNPTYTSEDVNLFTVNDAGDVKTMAGEATKNLHVSVTSTDEWNGFEKDYSITIVRDIMHVPFCINNQARYDRLEINALQKSWSDANEGTITIGTPELDISRKSTIIINISGTPDKLKIGDVTNSASGLLNAYIQEQGSVEKIHLGEVTAGQEFSLNSKVYAIQIEYIGKRTASISGICITEKVDVTCAPEEITLMKVNNVINPVNLAVEYSNMTEGSMKIVAGSLDADLFEMSCDGHASSQQIDLTYADGLGVDQSPTIQVSVAYKENPNDINLSTIQNPVATITVMGTNGDVAVEKIVKVNIGGVELTPEGLPNIIVSSTAEHPGIYTGTNKSSNDFPYHTKRQVNLSRCFDANTRMALFDILYIFGVTTNTSGDDDIYAPTDVLECNAKTPCYVYQKGPMGDRYVYHETFDAASTRFDHGTTMSGKHLYFTGYCPFAYVGTTKDENGWMYFQGNTGVSDRVDIYLDSCQIFARLKTPNGNHGAYNNYDLVISIEQLGAAENQINYNYLSGYSSPFVFTSGTKNSGTSFRPTIHIAGKNHVKGQLGSLIHNTIADVTPVLGALGSLAGDMTKINLGISGVNTYSAPIAVKPTDVGQYTDLTMTDIWKDNTITNGYIRLDAADVLGKVSETALSIDLGSATGSLTINGGQYHMRNAAADGNYTCNLAVGYKMYPRSEQALGATLQVRLYGFGDDQTDSKVTINSGTFTMYKNMYALPTGDLLGTDYYKDQTNFLDLRLPAGKGNSRINGGTFNGISNVVTCKSTISTGADPINEKFWLTLWDVPITGTNPDGSAQFSLDDIEHIEDAYSYKYPIVTYSLVTDIENVKNASQYGGQSANAYKKTIDGVEKDVVTLLLPGDLFGLPEKSEVQLRNWVTAVPYLEASKKLAGLVDASLIQGGPIDVEVSSLSENIKYENKQLIFADLEGLEGYQYTIPAQGAGMRIKENENAFGQINNTDSYEITNNLNLLKVVQADTWYTFTAPFDVHEISVIEANNASYNESTIATNSRADAMRLQAEANLHLMYGIYTLIIPNEDGRASSLSFEEMLEQGYVLQNKQKLNHYDGTNMMTAHYYLYELDPDSLDTNGHFSTNGTGTTLNIDWKPVATPAAGAPILTKGKVYVMQFPWCPMCNDLYVDDPAKKRTYYDYWSNKMILFHGNGPQTIEGSSSQSTILSPPAERTAKLTGNSTFADMTLAAETGYVHNTTTDYFEQKNDSYTLKPTEGFLLYNPGAKSMPARISRTGQIEYDENTETGVDGVPTVGDRTSLMLFGAYDGFEVLALHEQLVTVYNLQGNIIFQQYMTAGEQVYMATGAGIYVVRGESEAIKVMIE